LLAPERRNTCVAAARRVSPELKQLQEAHPGRLVLTHVDVADESSISDWAKGLAEQVRGWIALTTGQRLRVIFTPTAAEFAPVAGLIAEQQKHLLGLWRVVLACAPWSAGGTGWRRYADMRSAWDQAAAAASTPDSCTPRLLLLLTGVRTREPSSMW
jgi:hypothetical protein